MISFLLWKHARKAGMEKLLKRLLHETVLYQIRFTVCIKSNKCIINNNNNNNNNDNNEMLCPFFNTPISLILSFFTPLENGIYLNICDTWPITHQLRDEISCIYIIYGSIDLFF